MRLKGLNGLNGLKKKNSSGVAFKLLRFFYALKAIACSLLVAW